MKNCTQINYKKNVQMALKFFFINIFKNGSHQLKDQSFSFKMTHSKLSQLNLHYF